LIKELRVFLCNFFFFLLLYLLVYLIYAGRFKGGFLYICSVALVHLVHFLLLVQLHFGSLQPIPRLNPASSANSSFCARDPGIYAGEG
jgi:hypothetical protein